MLKICKLFLAALALMFCCLASNTARADTTVTLNFVDSGWYIQNGLHFSDSRIYLVGHSGESEFHNFFVFDLSSLPPGTITNATLRLYHPELGYSSSDESETYTLFDVSTPISDLRAAHTEETGGLRPDIYNDLGSGTIFGSIEVPRPDVNTGSTIISTSLNARALNALNSTRGLFAIGGAITSLNRSFGTSFDEYVFGGAGDANETRQLVLTIASPVLISEFRLRGPNGPTDEFVEILNRTNFPLTVSTTDNSAGWALVGADGLTRFIIPAGTVIPARGHYLGTNTGYSLSSYAAGTGTTAVGDDDSSAAPWTMEMADNSGIALFNTANAANFTANNLLDAVGMGNTAAPYVEGTPLPAIGSSDGEYSVLRKVVVAAGAFQTGLAQDTNNNASDFVVVSPTGGTLGGNVATVLGAPGPENLSSPAQRNAEIPAALLDPLQTAAGSNNRFRDATPNQVVCNGNCPFGTLSIRRTYTNNTGQPVTRLRFRIVDITAGAGLPGTADLRAITSADIIVNTTSGPVQVRGTTLETPPAQPDGGALNSSLLVGAINLGAPLGTTPPNNKVSVQFLLGIRATGNFRFLVNVESLSETITASSTTQSLRRRVIRQPLSRKRYMEEPQ